MLFQMDNLQKVIFNAKKHGGLVLQHQYLKIHQNGAKFTINKAYIDDEALEVDIPYTLIIIPENMAEVPIVLTYFDGKKGPFPFDAYPEILTKVEQRKIAEMMDVYDSEINAMFVQTGRFYCLNRFFDIPSQIARAEREFLMVSAVCPMQPHKEYMRLIGSILDEFVASLKKMDGLYAIFYDQKALEEHSKQTVKTDELRASVRASLTLVNERIQNLDAPKD